MSFKDALMEIFDDIQQAFARKISASASWAVFEKKYAVSEIVDATPAHKINHRNTGQHSAFSIVCVVFIRCCCHSTLLFVLMARRRSS
jgi:hypothetical protein